MRRYFFCVLRGGYFWFLDIYLFGLVPLHVRPDRMWRWRATDHFHTSTQVETHREGDQSNRQMYQMSSQSWFPSCRSREISPGRTWRISIWVPMKPDRVAGASCRVAARPRGAFVGSRPWPPSMQLCRDCKSPLAEGALSCQSRRSSTCRVLPGLPAWAGWRASRQARRAHAPAIASRAPGGYRWWTRIFARPRAQK